MSSEKYSIHVFKISSSYVNSLLSPFVIYLLEVETLVEELLRENLEEMKEMNHLLIG